MKFKIFLSKMLTVTVCTSLIAGFSPSANIFAEEVSSGEVLVEVAAEAPADQVPLEEIPVEQIPVEQIPVEQIPVEETTLAETPAEPPTVEAPVEASPVEIPAAEAPVAEIPVEDSLEQASVAETPMDVSADALTEVSAAEVPSEIVASSNEAEVALAEVNFASNAASSEYYQQPAWYTNDHYDAITVYLTNEAGEYTARCFFICDKDDQKEWLLYDYGETAAKEFFAKTELKDGKYIPVQKAESRKDNTGTTGIDESKIPTMSENAKKGMTYDWRKLEQVPFSRDSAGKIIYAGEKKNPDPAPTPTPAPTPDESLSSYTETVNGSTYTVRVTKSVSYCGKKHVAAGRKTNKNQVTDLTVQVFKGTEEIPRSNYTIVYGNNLNVNGYGKESYKPYIRINLKGNAYKKDSKLLSKSKFGFTIVPADLSKLGVSVKKVRVDGTKVTLGSPTVKIGGTTIKLSLQSKKNPKTGSYTATMTNNTITVVGMNNFASSTTLDLTKAKKQDYIF